MDQAVSYHLRDGAPARSPSDALSWGALLAGGALALFGLTRRSAVGYALAFGGATLAFATAAGAARSDRLARASVHLNTSPEDAYRFWRDFESLPRFMHHLDSVSKLDQPGEVYRWSAIGPMGQPVQWDAEIVNDRPGELIAWRSREGSTVDVSGFVEFRRAPGDRGTYLNAAVSYRPPAGAAGRIVAQLLGKDPSFMMQGDLRRMKALVETGEVPTTEGQSHGPRSAVSTAARLIDPDRPLRRDTRMREAFTAKRRVS